MDLPGNALANREARAAAASPDGIDNTFAGYVAAGGKEDYRRGAF